MSEQTNFNHQRHLLVEHLAWFRSSERTVETSRGPYDKRGGHRLTLKKGTGKSSARELTAEEKVAEMVAEGGLAVTTEAKEVENDVELNMTARKASWAKLGRFNSLNMEAGRAPCPTPPHPRCVLHILHVAMFQLSNSSPSHDSFLRYECLGFPRMRL